MTIPATSQTKTKTASGGRTPQADAHTCVSNFNPFEPEYVRVWESYYGKLVPDGYVVHHMRGDGPHGIDPLFLVAMERGQHPTHGYPPAEHLSPASGVGSRGWGADPSERGDG